MNKDSPAVVSPNTEALRATPIAYDIERQIKLSSGLIELGKFSWLRPIEVDLFPKSDRFSCSLALSPRPSHGRLLQLDGGADQNEGDVLGRVMLLDPGRAYRLSLPAGKVRSLYCEIDRVALEKALNGPVNFEGSDWRTRLQSRMPVIELLLNRMYEELRHESYGVELALNAYLQALFVELVRCLRDKKEHKGLHKGGVPPWRMRLLKSRIYADAPAPRLPELAEICGMTVRQLSRSFKEETGRAIGEFVGNVTMDRAKLLLTQSNHPIGEIAQQLGFASSTSFSYAFRHAIGILPREYRQRAKVN